jgi:hypothetical protein
VPFGAEAFLVDGGPSTLFACSDDHVYLTTNLGIKWQRMNLTPLADRRRGGTAKCLAIAPVPHPGTTAFQLLVVRTQSGGCTNGTGCQEVTVVDFSASTIHNLGFSSVAGPGSGVAAIAAVQNPSLPLLVPIPGENYDIYAADSLKWFQYSTATPHWRALPSNVHVDTWAIAIPSWYDPSKGHCGAYVATDGGVTFNFGQPGQSLTGGSCASAPWSPVQNGLHALEGTVVTAITAGSAAYAKGSLPLAIYLPTGDNDAFVMDTATCSPGSGPVSCTFHSPAWKNMNSLGDAGNALFEPAYPEQVLLTRNCDYQAYGVPSVAGTFTEMIPAALVGCNASTWFDNGGQGVGTFDLTEVKTTPAELSSPVSHVDYIAVQDLDPVNCGAGSDDLVVRNTSKPLDASAWFDLSPGDHFHACDIRKVQAGGGHSSGLNVYVLTTLRGDVTFPAGRKAGQIYRGVVKGTGAGATISSWSAASGTAAKPLGQADNFYVNPFDPSELYAVDVLDQVIMVSRDSGGTWDVEAAMTDIATNHGEYLIGCNGSRGGGYQSDPFTNDCSIGWIAFDVFHPNIRVVGAAYGGIALSRDNGHHWMALDVTHNDHLVSDNLTELVGGVAFDGETPFPDLGKSDQTIYAALKGRSMVRVVGPFLSLEALNFSYAPAAASNSVFSVDISTLGVTVKLRKDPDGVYRGTALFDSNGNHTLTYSLTIDGTPTKSQTYALTTADIANGVATVPL